MKSKCCEHNPHYTEGYREEIPDQKPVAVPVGFSEPESLESMMQRLMDRKAQAEIRNAGFDSEEEANDFEVDDDDPVISGLQVYTMEEDMAAESKRLNPGRKGGDPNGGGATNSESGGNGGKPAGQDSGGGTVEQDGASAAEGAGKSTGVNQVK